MLYQNQISCQLFYQIQSPSNPLPNQSQICWLSFLHLCCSTSMWFNSSSLQTLSVLVKIAQLTPNLQFMVMHVCLRTYNLHIRACNLTKLLSARNAFLACQNFRLSKPRKSLLVCIAIKDSSSKRFMLFDFQEIFKTWFLFYLVSY